MARLIALVERARADMGDKLTDRKGAGRRKPGRFAAAAKRAATAHGNPMLTSNRVVDESAKKPPARRNLPSWIGLTLSHGANSSATETVL